MFNANNNVTAATFNSSLAVEPNIQRDHFPTAEANEEEEAKSPALKIIVLIRDPRAVINSLRLSPDSWGEDVLNVDRICHNILSNIDTFRNASETASKRVYLLKYEVSSTKYVHSARASFMDFFSIAELRFGREENKDIGNCSKGKTIILKPIYFFYFLKLN